jgi:transcriptional regulator with XRE-family HTH domain
MYFNLLDLMKRKGITQEQMANLLGCRIATVSDKLRGIVQVGFTVKEAMLIHDVFFPEYTMSHVFKFEEKEGAA